MAFSKHKTVIFISILNILALFMKLSFAQNSYDDRWRDNYNSHCPHIYPRNFIGYAPRGNCNI